MTTVDKPNNADIADLGFSAVLDDGLLSHGDNSVQPGGRDRSGTGSTISGSARTDSLAQAITLLQPREDVRLAQIIALLSQAQMHNALSQAQMHNAQAAATSAKVALTILDILKDREAILALVDTDNGETEAELTKKLRQKARQMLLG